MARLKGILGRNREARENEPETEGEEASSPIMTAEHAEDREHDISILADEDGTKEQRLQQQATKEVQSAAEDSLKKLHVLRLGRCPSCGEHVRRHLFASICESCGWHNFDVPRNGPVRVHLTEEGRVIEGERCYSVKSGALLVVKDDLVVAKVARDAYDLIEYVWSPSEIKQRHMQLADQLQVTCGWCNGKADPEEDGFHLVHVAFGATQERYCFCCDECYEAFRKMYPARVHRNCYERDCSQCNLCVKRYADGSEGMHLLAKDYVMIQKNRK
jgi:ribosomal protein L32